MSGSRRRTFLPPSYKHRHGAAERVELGADRVFRERNKVNYRFAHWPIWIWVFFIAPAPVTIRLFSHGFDRGILLWLAVVMVGTGIAGLRGRLPGVEPAPYILRFGEDRPNPLYRRVCYTFAWSATVSFALLNLAGLVDAVFSGQWRLRQMYEVAYFPLTIAVCFLGLLGRLPRVGPSTKNEGLERRYFYGSVWAVCLAQPFLWLLWRTLPHGRTFDVLKLLAFVSVLAVVGELSRRGLLPRTRPILQGELARGD